MDDLFSYGPKNIREFFRLNIIPVLLTIILHLVVAIVLVLVKVDGLKQDQELGVLLDFSDEEKLEALLEEENIEVPEAWLEQVYEAREKASNRVVNVEDRLKEEISTSDYVNELLNELESQKDQDFIENREKWEEVISSYVYEEPAIEETISENEEENEFVGPTTIEYEFLDEPKDRKNRYFSVPVYKCEGSALVVIDLVVKSDGTVARTSVVSINTSTNSECFIEAAENAARSSRFYSSNQAPEKHIARVTYQFIAQ